MFKGALFDLDGVIADTSSLHFQAWQKLTNNYFAAELPDYLEEQTKGVSRGDSLQVILDHLDVGVSESMFQQLLIEKNELYLASLKNLSPKNILPGISEFIAELKENEVKLALASASLNGPAILDKLQLTDAFDAIADPSKVAQGKPAPDIFLAAAKALDLEPAECVGIEDSIAGITAISVSGALPIAIGTNAEFKAAFKTFAKTAELNLSDVRAVYDIFKKEHAIW